MSAYSSRDSGCERSTVKVDVPWYSSSADHAWHVLKTEQIVRMMDPLPQSTPKPPGHTRFVCISDTHTNTSGLEIPAGDVLIHAGDFTYAGAPREVSHFREFLDSLPHKHKVVIAGNHEATFDSKKYNRTFARAFGHDLVCNSEEVKSIISTAAGVIYLEDSGYSISGIRIWGSPWQPVYCESAFTCQRGRGMQEKWDLIPENTDILITHGPPLGHGDRCSHGGRAGCVNLLLTIQQRVKPKYHVFGHIHEGHGITTDNHTIFINCAVCDMEYSPVQKPIIFDFPTPSPQKETTV